MRNAKTLLELLTKEYPPFPGAKHAFLVHEGKVLIALAFGPSNWQHINVDDADLDRAPEDLMTDIRDVLKAVEYDKEHAREGA